MIMRAPLTGIAIPICFRIYLFDPEKRSQEENRLYAARSRDFRAPRFQTSDTYESLLLAPFVTV